MHLALKDKTKRILQFFETVKIDINIKQLNIIFLDDIIEKYRFKSNLKVYKLMLNLKI